MKFPPLFVFILKTYFSQYLYKILRKEEKQVKIFKRLMTNSCYCTPMIHPGIRTLASLLIKTGHLQRNAVVPQ